MSRSFDAASGLPLVPSARRALEAALDRGWADPARLHRDGRVARQLLDAARASVADRIGALPQEVVFTASGTQALHAAILGLARGRRKVGPTVVASAVEHSAVLRAADWVMLGDDPVLIPVNPQGEVEVKAFRRAVRSSGVALAAVQHVNHEVGAIQPLEAVHEAAQAAGVPLVVDACAALGSVPPTAHWDVLAGSAHKWGGPAGVGILAVRTGIRWRSPLPTDEAGRWAGFPNVPGAVAAATALEQATAALGQTSVHRARLLTILRERVPGVAPDVLVLGRADSAPHIVCFTVLYADGEVLVTELDRAGFAVSSGSACTADTRRPSHVLAAMGAITHGNLRVSLPPDATEADVAGFLAALPGAIAAARASADRATS
ncbi:MAG TPA: aminotransferase class V-fold PLP-dependent enzyme [Motilibacterales bacterium]|nr:aminotransferase class V-fold PLP-dependent enzyme [Motilibacterales bacterium]